MRTRAVHPGVVARAAPRRASQQGATLTLSRTCRPVESVVVTEKRGGACKETPKEDNVSRHSFFCSELVHFCVRAQSLSRAFVASVGCASAPHTPRPVPLSRHVSARAERGGAQRECETAATG